MSRLATLLFPALTVLAACSPEAERGMLPESDAESRDGAVAVAERLTAAAIAKDVEAFMTLWERSDSVVYSRHGRTFVGWEEIRAEHARAFSGPEPWSSEAGAVYARSLGPNAGVVTSFTRLSDPEESNWFIITATVQRAEGAWRIVQAHGSYPPPGVTPRGEVER